MTPHRLAKQQHKHTRKSFWGTISERSIAVPLKAHANERATDTCCRHRRAEIKRIARPEYGLHGLRRNRCGYTPNWNGPTRSLVTTARVPFSSIGSATLEKGTPAVVTSQYGLPKPWRPEVTSDQYGLEKPWRPDPKQILAAVPAPAPDMTSPLVLAAQPTSTFETVTPAAREARAKASPEKVRVEVSVKKARAKAPPQNQRTQPSHYQQTLLYDRFSIRGY
jgi:hypothetical protein